MPYQKQTWVDFIIAEDTGEVLQIGSLLQASRLNHMEDGIAAATQAIENFTVDSDGLTLQGIQQSIDNAMQSKVDKVPNMGLSSNDFSDYYKDKLDNQLTYTEIRDLLKRVEELEDWKSKVLAGTTPVNIDQ